MHTARFLKYVCPFFNILYFLYKQPVFKELAFEWQIDNQLSGLNNKNYTLKKSGVFYNKCKIAVKWTIHQNSPASKALLGKF